MDNDFGDIEKHEDRNAFIRHININQVATNK